MNASSRNPAHSPHPDIIRPRSGPRSGALRVVRIEPPLFGPEAHSAGGVPVQATLPLAGFGSSAEPTTPTAPRAAPPPGRQPTDAELRHLAQQFCVGVAEVIYGDRAVSQLLRCTSERVYRDLAKRSAMTKSLRRMTNERVARARLERIRLQRPSPKAVEICARLSQGERSHALATRLELINGRWICVAFEAPTS